MSPTLKSLEIDQLSVAQRVLVVEEILRLFVPSLVTPLELLGETES